MMKSESSGKSSNLFNTTNSISSFKNAEVSSVVYESGVSLGT